jgi:hypothetical protein
MCNGTSAFPDSFMIFILLFYSCFTLISFSYFNAMTLLFCVYYFPFNTRWRIQTPCLNHPPIFFHLYVIHLIVSRYYPFIVYLPKISALPTLFPEGLNETRPVFLRISPYVARAKSKSIKPRRKSYSVRTLIPSTHSRLFESCSSFYFPLP